MASCYHQQHRRRSSSSSGCRLCPARRPASINAASLVVSGAAQSLQSMHEAAVTASCLSVPAGERLLSACLVVILGPYNSGASATATIRDEFLCTLCWRIKYSEYRYMLHLTLDVAYTVGHKNVSFLFLLGKWRMI